MYLSSKPLASMLFKSFVVSLLMYCLPVLHTSIYAKDKKLLRKVFNDAKNLGLDVGDLDTIVKQRTKSIIMCCFSDEDHFIHGFLQRCPSGRLRHVKYRSSWGKDCFLRQMCITLNEILFWKTKVPYTSSKLWLWQSICILFSQHLMFVIANKSININTSCSI